MFAWLRNHYCFVFSISCLFMYLSTVLLFSKMASKKLLSVEYEVYGRVQGVFFRKYTQKESQKLGLRGWCMNTDSGTVKGIMEGEESKVNNMKSWLQTKGSPQSRIDKAEFKNEKEIPKFSYDAFSIKR